MEFWHIFPLAFLFLLFFSKVPIPFAMLISALVYFLFNPGTMSTEFLMQRLTASYESFVFLAIPFFTCAGVVFNYSGITKRLMGLAESLVGHFHGGLAQVVILLAAMMGGLSGSANADAAMETKILVPEMTKLGYAKPFSCAVVAAASVVVPIIPPGIILILYATCSNTSIAKMFCAGYAPGIIMVIALMIYSRRVAIKRHYNPTRQTRATGKEVLFNLKQSIWALAVPFGIILGLRFGWFTPTEAGAVCVVYGLFVGAFVYKELTPSSLIDILKESVEANASVMFIIGSAQVFGVYLTWENIPSKLADFMLTYISEPWVFLLFVNVLLIVVGCFFDGCAAVILLAPILVPIASVMGIDLLHFGIVMCVNLCIGGITPPFGTMMFVTCSIAEVKIEAFVKEILPYLIVLVICLLILTFIPGISLILPEVLL